jgi:transcriptional regulator with XRE-family HTH domain
MSGLPNTLRKARLNAGLTQRQVADALAVPHTYPSRWERGAARPGPANLLALADLLALDPADLLRMYTPAGRRAAPAAGVEPSPRQDAAAADALAAALTDAASEVPKGARRRRRAGGRPEAPPAGPETSDS